MEERLGDFEMSDKYTKLLDQIPPCVCCYKKEMCECELENEAQNTYICSTHKKTI